MQLMQLERTVAIDAYSVEVASHGDEYGFMVYIERDGVKELVRWDFGYDGVETAEYVALTSILRDMSEVIETDNGSDHDLLADNVYTYYYKFFLR